MIPILLYFCHNHIATLTTISYVRKNFKFHHQVKKEKQIAREKKNSLNAVNVLNSCLVSPSIQILLQRCKCLGHLKINSLVGMLNMLCDKKRKDAATKYKRHNQETQLTRKHHILPTS